MSPQFHGRSSPATLGWMEGLGERLPRTPWRTRFAPAPTGALHLGHLVNAIHVWGIARAFGGRVALRVEDHDRSRCRPEYERALLDDLEWLGFEPDLGSIASYAQAASGHPYRQSDNDERYRERLQQLDRAGLVFVCDCSRRTIADTSGPSGEDELRYPGTCRDRGLDPVQVLGRRVRMDPGTERFDDLRIGPVGHDASQQCGDLLVRDRRGNWTYQFAVTVDDLVHEIDVVIRGEDLLTSTARQLRLGYLLGRMVPPVFLHHALLLHDDGTKLSKARQDTSLREHRAAGARPDQLLGEAAYLAGLLRSATSLSASDVAGLFVRG